MAVVSIYGNQNKKLKYELDKNNNFIDITEKLHEYRFG